MYGECLADLEGLEAFSAMLECIICDAGAHFCISHGRIWSLGLIFSFLMIVIRSLGLISSFLMIVIRSLWASNIDISGFSDLRLELLW